MTEQEIEQWKEKIANMSQLEMARLFRFSPSGHPVIRFLIQNILCLKFLIKDLKVWEV